jgi:hypothetical protein
MRVVILSLCFFACAAAQVVQPGQLAAGERLDWAIYSTIGPPNMGAGLFKAGLQTWINDPDEYGPGWEGYGRRYALRLPGIAVSNLMEAGVGSLWGEDPRYHRTEGATAGGRMWNVMKATITARDRDGHSMPAYARFIAVPVSNIISNTWRPDSQRTAEHTLGRVSFGFLSRMASNAFHEFWPDVKQHVFRRAD